MKVQDIAFIIVFILVLLKKNERFLVACGLFAVLCSVPLFMIHIFFTAQRLVMYGSVFFLATIALSIKRTT